MEKRISTSISTPAYEAGRAARAKGHDIIDAPDYPTESENWEWTQGYYHEGVDLIFRLSGITLSPRFEGPHGRQTGDTAKPLRETGAEGTPEGAPHYEQ